MPALPRHPWLVCYSRKLLGLLSTRGNLRKPQRFCPYLVYHTTASLGLNCLFFYITHIFKSLVKGESTWQMMLASLPLRRLGSSRRSLVVELVPVVYQRETHLDPDGSRLSLSKDVQCTAKAGQASPVSSCDNASLSLSPLRVEASLALRWLPAELAHHNLLTMLDMVLPF